MTTEEYNEWQKQYPHEARGLHVKHRARIDTLTKQVESLKLSLSGKTNFDEVAELKRQMESQKEEILKTCMKIVSEAADWHSINTNKAIIKHFQLPKEE